MHPPGANWTIVGVPSCKRNDNEEWQCHVIASMPQMTDAFVPMAGKRIDLTVRASCSATRCELSRNDWTVYASFGSAPWKAVINDWYNGGIDHSHSCAAVKVAISHLPVGGGPSSARNDFEAYERKVC